jgi:hypothetical protein
MKRRIIAFILALTPCAPAAAEDFVLERVADTTTAVPDGTGTFSDLREPAIVGRDLVFEGTDASSNEGIYARRGGVLLKVADTGDLFPGSANTFDNFDDDGPTISRRAIAFLGYEDGTGNDGIFTDAAAPFQTVAIVGTTLIPDGSGDAFSGLSSDQASLSGTDVAFEGFGPNGQNGIYGHFGGVLETVADIGDPSPNGSTFDRAFDEPSLQGRNVAFEARTNGGTVQGVFARIDGTMVTIADSNTAIPGGSGDDFTFCDDPRIDRRTVVFEGLAPPGTTERGVYARTAGGPLTIIADVNTPVPGGTGNFTGFESASVSGSIFAFRGTDEDGDKGIYMLVNGLLRQVVSEKDSIDGVGIDFIEFMGEGHHQRCIGFKAAFDDDSQAVFLACLPETTGAPLLGGLGLGLAAALLLLGGLARVRRTAAPH